MEIHVPTFQKSEQLEKNPSATFRVYVDSKQLARLLCETYYFLQWKPNCSHSTPRITLMYKYMHAAPVSLQLANPLPAASLFVIAIFIAVSVSPHRFASSNAMQVWLPLWLRRGPNFLHSRIGIDSQVWKCNTF